MDLGRAWQHESPALSPSPRGAAATAYDPTSGLVILFGGIGGQSGATDTWVWNGTTWTQLHPSATPPATFGRAFMDFDPVSQHVILLTDPDLGGTPRDATWEWTGATWTLIDTHGPIGEGPGGLDQNPPAAVDPRPRVGGTFDPATAVGLDPARNRLNGRPAGPLRRRSGSGRRHLGVGRSPVGTATDVLPGVSSSE